MVYYGSEIDFLVERNEKQKMIKLTVFNLMLILQKMCSHRESDCEEHNELVIAINIAL